MAANEHMDISFVDDLVNISMADDLMEAPSFVCSLLPSPAAHDGRGQGVGGGMHEG